MDRRNVTAVIVATVGILAIALAAATLPTAVVPGGGAGADEAGPGVPMFDPPAERPVDGVDLTLLNTILRLLFLLTVLILGYMLLYRRDAPLVLVGVLVLVGLTWLVFHLVSGPFTAAELPVPGQLNVSPAGGGQGGGTDGTASPAAAPVVASVLLGLAVLGAALVLARSSTARLRIGSWIGVADPDGRARSAAIGRAAGRAAARIDQRADVANEVYRAWQEMTTLLDVPNPDTTAPREFSAAAIDAGMASRDVDELTRLFEDVRYGGHRPTTARERRAVDVFRRIELTYRSEES